MTTTKELGQDPIKNLKLARNAIQSRIACAGRIDRSFYLFESEGMITDLPQLHDLILQSPNPRRFRFRIDRTVGEDHSMLLDLSRELELKRGHATFDHSFDLVRQIRFDVLFQSTEEKRSENFVQTSNDEEGFFFVHFDLILSSRIGERRVEPFVERLDRTKDFRQDEIE